MMLHAPSLLRREGRAASAPDAPGRQRRRAGWAALPAILWPFLGIARRQRAQAASNGGLRRLGTGAEKKPPDDEDDEPQPGDKVPPGDSVPVHGKRPKDDDDEPQPGDKVPPGDSAPVHGKRPKDDDASNQASGPARDAVLAERARCRAIMDASGAAMRPALARHLAFETDLPSEVACSLLDTATLSGEPARPTLHERMARQSIPHVGLHMPGADHPSPGGIAAGIIADYEKARGLWKETRR